jgi:hypothetical protein
MQKRYNIEKEDYMFHIRNIPPYVYSRLKYIASLKKTSLNDLINDVLLEFINDFDNRDYKKN